MCRYTAFIACIALAGAKDFMANQKLMDRSKNMGASWMDATTLAKPGTALQPATMNRLPVTVGRAGYPVPRTRMNAGLQEGTVAGRYAQGLFEHAEELKEVDTVMEGVTSMELTLSEVPELAQMLSNPVVPEADKRGLIDKILEKGTMNKMCNYLIDKNRIDVFPEILGAYGSLYNEKNGIEMIEVKSACKLTEDQLSKIGDEVKSRTGAKSVKITEKLDENLIGGFIVSYGGQQVDLSIRSGLEAVKKEIAFA